MREADKHENTLDTVPDEVLLTQSLLKEQAPYMPWLEQTALDTAIPMPTKLVSFDGDKFKRYVDRNSGNLIDTKLDESDFEDDNCECSWCSSSSDLSCWRVIFCSRLGRLMLFCTTLLIVYLFYSGLAGDSADANFEERAASTVVNYSRADAVLVDLCDAYGANNVSGDLCNRLCYNRTWNIIDIYEGNKIVITLKQGGQEVVLKSQHPSIRDFEEVSFRVKEDMFTDTVLDIINENLCLGWPKHYKRHLIETLWPSYIRASRAPLSEADRRSLWALIAQDEYIVFQLLPLSRVTPRVVGTCGHFYQVEHLIPFRMKSYYTKLKAKILVHLMGTLKLFDEFLNEPLQWCDVKFDNLGLAADYPKRFMIMDADMLFTTSRLQNILTSRKCEKDEDCEFFDCESQCSNVTNHCSARVNNNLEVFCKKLVHQLFGGFGSKANRYLAACYDTESTMEERMNSLRLAWAWNLADV